MAAKRSGGRPNGGPSASGDGAADGVPRSVGRALDLLEIVLGNDSCNLTAAATAAGLTPTTALRHLRALEARGYIDRTDAGQYTVGPTMMRLSAVLSDGGRVERLIAVAQPYLDRLARETGESTYLAVSDGRVATYVAASASPRAIRHVGWVGQDIALDGTATGEALATPGRTATRTGAVEPDITAVSRAVPPIGRLGVAISVIGPEHRLRGANRRAVEHALRMAVDELGADLGSDREAAAS